MPETATAPQEAPTAQAVPIPAKIPRKNQFTSANAREMHAKATASRLANTKRRNEPPPLPTPSEPATPDPFYSKTLARVRRMISRLQEMLETEEDPNKIDRLSSSLAKHEEVERRISDRSLPAVRRVQDQGKPSRASSLLGD